MGVVNGFDDVWNASNFEIICLILIVVGFMKTMGLKCLETASQNF